EDPGDTSASADGCKLSGGLVDKRLWFLTVQPSVDVVACKPSLTKGVLVGWRIGSL
ncbi:MAG: hypothetical protein JWN45_1035, partial [Acidobacteriaceae bacterium]|nr:hypothetical protein [Acidobacteriaceae bacterium]